jgi:hypothetical protein
MMTACDAAESDDGRAEQPGAPPTHEADDMDEPGDDCTMRRPDESTYESDYDSTATRTPGQESEDDEKTRALRDEAAGGARLPTTATRTANTSPT